MNSPVISIVIPAYNAEKTITRACESVLSQVYQDGKKLFDDDIEIIIVDDGSKDNTLQICKSLEIKYPQVKVFTKGNEGVSSARNFGVTKACGEYIQYLDADDELYQGAYIYIYQLIKKYNPAIISFWRTHISTADVRQHNEHATITFEGELKQYLQDNWVTGSVFEWIFRRSEYVENKIRFSTHVIIAEDLCHNSIALPIYADKLYIQTNVMLYKYTYNPNSALNTLDQSRLERNYNAYLEAYDFLSERYNKEHGTYNETFINHYLYFIKRPIVTRLLSLDYNYSDCKNALRILWQKGVLPLDSSFQNNILNVVAKNPCLFWVVAKLYRKIFLPYFRRLFGRG
jgi:glycosyltransferase involved in cell wall biosynthesis